METKESCRVLLDRGVTQRVKCYKFMHNPFNRELAVHENVDSKTQTSISDVKTGLRMCGLHKPIDKVTMEDVTEAVENFLRHFTLEATLEEFEKLDLPCS